MINGSISSSVHSQTIVTPWKDWTDRGSKTALSPLQDTLRPWHALEGLDRKWKKTALNGSVSSSGHSGHVLKGLHRKRKKNCVKWLCLFFRTLKARIGRTAQTEEGKTVLNGYVSSLGHSGHTLEGLDRQREQTCIKWAISLPLYIQDTHWKEWTDRGSKPASNGRYLFL